MSPQGNADPAFMNGVLTTSSTTPQSSSTTTPTSQSSSTSTSTSTSSSSASSSSTTSQSTKIGSTTSVQSLSTATKITPSPTPALSATNASSNSASVYVYDPSVAGAIAFSVLYLLQLIYHFYLSIYIPHIRKSVTNKHNYTIPLFVAAALSTLGFSVRIASVDTEAGRSSFTLYAISTCCLIIAPIFVCATLYLMIAHLIRLCLPHGSEQNFLGINPKWLGRLFITSDVLSFLSQSAGIAIASSGDWMGARRTLGVRILTVGLTMQVGTFTVYMVILLLFCMKASAGKNKKVRGEREMNGGEPDGMDASAITREFGFNPLVKQVVKGMWIASVLIEIRSVYRTIEFGMGADGYLFRHEWPLWVFEAVPIWIALLVLGIYHPTLWLQQKRRSAFLHSK